MIDDENLGVALEQLESFLPAGMPKHLGLDMRHNREGLDQPSEFERREWGDHQELAGATVTTQIAPGPQSTASFAAAHVIETVAASTGTHERRGGALDCERRSSRILPVVVPQNRRRQLPAGGREREVFARSVLQDRPINPLMSDLSRVRPHPFDRAAKGQKESIPGEYRS